jgi:hypothetical protein
MTNPRFGFHSIYINIVKYIENLDVEHIRSKLRLPPIDSGRLQSTSVDSDQHTTVPRPDKMSHIPDWH